MCEAHIHTHKHTHPPNTKQINPSDKCRQLGAIITLAIWRFKLYFRGRSPGATYGEGVEMTGREKMIPCTLPCSTLWCFLLIFIQGVFIKATCLSIKPPLWRSGLQLVQLWARAIKHSLRRVKTLCSSAGRWGVIESNEKLRHKCTFWRLKRNASCHAVMVSHDLVSAVL